MPQEIITTTEMTEKRPSIVFGRDQNILVWTGMDYVINISSSPMDTFNFKSSPTKFKTYKDPTLVMFPTGDSGYLFWTGTTKTDDGYQILYAEVKRDANGKLVLDDRSTELTSAISLDGIIAATLTTQNGQLVINLAWRNQHKHVCLTQIQPWKKVMPSWSQTQLDQKANTGPALATIGGRPIMVYFDDNKHLNIVLAPKNTINFDLHNKVIFKDISSNFAPAVVIQSIGIGYVFWVGASDAKLNYHQIGMDARGEVVMNTQVEGSGVIKDAIAVAAPSARMVARQTDGQHAALLQVVWAQSGSRYIKIAEFEPHYTALT